MNKQELQPTEQGLNNVEHQDGSNINKASTGFKHTVALISGMGSFPGGKSTQQHASSVLSPKYTRKNSPFQIFDEEVLATKIAQVVDSGEFVYDYELEDAVLEVLNEEYNRLSNFDAAAYLEHIMDFSTEILIGAEKNREKLQSTAKKYELEKRDIEVNLDDLDDFDVTNFTETQAYVIKLKKRYKKMLLRLSNNRDIYRNTKKAFKEDLTEVTNAFRDYYTSLLKLEDFTQKVYTISASIYEYYKNFPEEQIKQLKLYLVKNEGLIDNKQLIFVNKVDKREEKDFPIMSLGRFYHLAHSKGEKKQASTRIPLYEHKEWCNCPECKTKWDMHVKFLDEEGYSSREEYLKERADERYRMGF